jgi:hypothetical protein
MGISALALAIRVFLALDVVCGFYLKIGEEEEGPGPVENFVPH